MSNKIRIELSPKDCVNVVTMIHESVRLLAMDQMLLKSCKELIVQITDNITSEQIDDAEAEIRTALQLRDLGINTDETDTDD